MVKKEIGACKKQNNNVCVMITWKNESIEELRFNLLEFTKNEIKQFQHRISSEKVELMNTSRELKKQQKIVVNDREVIFQLSNSVVRERAHALKKLLVQHVLVKENNKDDFKIHPASNKNIPSGMVKDVNKKKRTTETPGRNHHRLYRFNIQFEHIHNLFTIH